MKFVIYKYTLTGETTELNMLYGATVLDVQMQNDKLVLWAKGEISEYKGKRLFITRPTGHEYEIGSEAETYVATVQDARTGLVWHIFEIT